MDRSLQSNVSYDVREHVDLTPLSSVGSPGLPKGGGWEKKVVRGTTNLTLSQNGKGCEYVMIWPVRGPHNVRGETVSVDRFAGQGTAARKINLFDPKCTVSENCAFIKPMISPRK